MPYRLSIGIGIVALALSMAPASPIRADSGSPVTANEKGPHDAAACEIQAVPHCGDMAAQYHLGLMFKNGLGVPKDSVAALGWFLCAARSDGQIGIDAARWAEQLSSSLGGPAVVAARSRVLGCRTLAEIDPQAETRVAFERPDARNPPYWENLEFKLDQFIEALLRFEFAEPGGGTSADRTAASEAPHIRTQGIAFVPDRRDVWSRVFFLPADGTIVGSQHIAWKLGADDMLRDLREIAHDRDDITLGLFAVFWWVLIGKSLLSVGRAILGPNRKSGARRHGRNGLIAP